MIYVFVNDRRVDEFPLMQAVHYAYEPYLPGGRFPAAFVYLRIDPAQADFNIHPAKREVRFRDPRAVHHAVVQAVTDATSVFAGKIVSFHPPEAPSASQT